MKPEDLSVIDVHSHFSLHGIGPDSPSRNVSLDWIRTVARSAGVSASFCTTIEAGTAGQGADEANRETFATADRYPDIFGWVVVNPLEPNTFEKAEAWLKHPKAVGLKAMPLGHGYRLTDYEKELFGFAAEVGRIIQIQVEGSAEFVGDMALRNPHTQILLGANNLNGYYEAMEKATDENLYLDLGGGAQYMDRIVENLVDRFGSDRILFGSDGLLAPGFIRGRVEYARIGEEDKIRILRTNALSLFENVLKGAQI